jgi:FRG domain-containing protein
MVSINQFASEIDTDTAARRKSGYRCRRFGHGYYTFEVDDFETFLNDIAPQFIDSLDRFVWRGARNPSWPLQSSLSRQIEGLKVKPNDEWKREVCRLTTKHILQFLDDLRGLHLLKPHHDHLHRALRELSYRKHQSFVTVLRDLGPAQEHVLYEVFSIGQHHGLFTPFLDWTDVPAVALFFAFSEPDDLAQPEGVGNRVVYALNYNRVTEVCPQNEAYNEDSILFLGSMAHDNPRIIGQKGLFTFIPAHRPVDEWVVNTFPRAEEPPVLIRFLIRNERRVRCLEHLASLNVHDRSVFPDLHGAAHRSNYLLLHEVST